MSQDRICNSLAHQEKQRIYDFAGGLRLCRRIGYVISPPIRQSKEFIILRVGCDYVAG